MAKEKSRVLQKVKKYQEDIKANVTKSYRHEMYRKSVHLSSLWIPAIIYFAHTGISVAIFLSLLMANLLLEYGNYKRWRWARIFFTVLFSKTLRNKERVRNRFTVTGSVYVLSSAIMCSLLFPKEVAAIALTVMLVSDTLAALVGKAFGTRKVYKQKSLEGTLAFFLSALIINMLFEPIYTFTYVSVIACFIATFVELFEDRLEMDDNLSIPLAIGAVLTLFS